VRSRADGHAGDYIEDQRFSGNVDVLMSTRPTRSTRTDGARPIRSRCHVAASGTDSDFVVKVIDVSDDVPGLEWTAPAPRPRTTSGWAAISNSCAVSRSQQVQEELREPMPFVPNQPDVVEFELPDVAHTFRAGHRLMVQVQSSWFPLTDRNPQTFTDIPRAKPEDFKRATQRVFRSTARPSSITFVEIAVTASSVSRPPTARPRRCSRCVLGGERSEASGTGLRFASAAALSARRRAACGSPTSARIRLPVVT
jgi:predicted acyl esterase